jgi:hypothetical protein
MIKQNLHILKFVNPFLGYSLHVFLFVAVILTTSLSAFAKKLNIYNVVPKWNNKTFCDNGIGQPAIITASTDAKLFDVNLSIADGSLVETYKWVNANKFNEIFNTKNAKNLTAGNYLVTINAEAYLPVNINISTNKLDKTNN